MLLIPLAHGVGMLFLLLGAIVISIVIPIVALSVLWIYLSVKGRGTESDSARTGMMASNRVWEPLGTWSPKAFLVAGVFLVVFTALGHVEVVTNTAVADPVRFAFGTAGFVVAFVGLFGLYPALADQTPWLARASVAYALVPALGWFALTMWNIGVVIRILQPGDTTPLIGGVYILTAIITVPVYVLFGLASFRADAHPRVVTLLLLAVPILVLLLFPLAGGLLFVFGSGTALAHLVIGFLLLARNGSPNRTEAPPDSTA